MHRLGPYLLLTRIGVGGMAEIFLARRGDQVVALKRILPHLAAHDDFVDMFVDEARLAARLRHPNIARVLDVGHEDGLWYIAMEYVPGEDLLTIIRRARERHMPTPLAVGASIIADAAAALHHAHEAKDEDGHSLGLVHRDVTPSNLIVSHEGAVKLVDFGIAKAERRVSVTAAGALKGKYAYMAPEHALGEPLDRRADVFSLGVVAWEMFTQRRLFHREHELAVLRAVTEERIPIPSERRGDLPAELDEIIMRALDRDRETRWPTARHMEAALRRFVSSRLEGEPTHAIADLMDHLFGVTVAEKRRRWAAGDLDEEPATQVEAFGTPLPTSPRSRVPDEDIDLQGEPAVHGELDDHEDDFPEPQTTVAIATPGARARAAAVPQTFPADATERNLIEPDHETDLEAGDAPHADLGGTVPQYVHMRPGRPVFANEHGADVSTDPVPKISGGPRSLRVFALGVALLGVAATIWILRPGGDERGGPEPAQLPQPGAGSGLEAGSGSGIPAALEAPILGTGERPVVTGAARPDHEPGEPNAQLLLEGPDGLVVTLDGEHLGALPLPRRRVLAGLHTVTIAGAAGGESQTFALELREGDDRVEVIRVDAETGRVVHQQGEAENP